MDSKTDSFPYFEPDNYHGWFIQFKSHCRGIGAHFALSSLAQHIRSTRTAFLWFSPPRRQKHLPSCKTLGTYKMTKRSQL